MKRTFQKILGLSLLTLASCSGPSQKVVAYDDEGYPLLTTGTLHDVSVRYGNREFVKDGSTEYQVIYDSKQKGAAQAAAYIVSNVYNATGAMMTSLDINQFDEDISRADHYIIVGSSDLFDDAGKTMPDYKTLGIAGYYISSYGNNVFLMAHRLSGYQQGALTLLRHVVGYDMISEDTVIYEKDGSVMPDMEIKERPDFDWAHPINNFTEKTKYGLGFSTLYSYIVPATENPKATPKTVHNVFNFLDPDLHCDASNTEMYHPEWFSDGREQLCYTAHGDKESLDLMVDTAFETVKKSVEYKTDSEMLNFTDNDVGNCCQCDACKASIEKDGGTISGAVIRFINRLDNKLQAYLQEEAEKTHSEKRTIHLQFFAYLSSLQAPTVSVEEDPTLKCNPDVSVMIAPLHANYTKTFYDKENAMYADTFETWSHYADHITAWLYETDYHHYIYPYNTYATMMKNYRFVKSKGASVMYNEGQRYNANVTCFGKLKEYLNSKAQFDVNANYTDYSEKFFTNYFKDAAPIMREYFEELTGWETYLESKPEVYGLGGGVYQEIGSKAEYWPKQMLVNWVDKMEEAYKTIEKYKTTDSSLYTTLSKHILIETMFPRFALCNLHGGTYAPEELRQMRLAFRKDAESIGMVEHMEHYFIDSVYATWGI